MATEPAATAAAGEGSPTPTMDENLDFLVSPRCFELYAASLKAENPIPRDWRNQLGKAMEGLTEECTVQDLIRMVASLSPDRGRTLIEVLEEEVSVLEDVVDHMALERLKRLRREHQAEIKALMSAYRQARVAAINNQHQLKSILPTFAWDDYYEDGSYLKRLFREKKNIERHEKLDSLREDIDDLKHQKRYLVDEIKRFRERRMRLEQRLKHGAKVDMEEEKLKMRRYNAKLRDRYEQLQAALAEQDKNRRPSVVEFDPYL